MHASLVPSPHYIATEYFFKREPFMRIRDTRSRFGAVSVINHWLTAAVFIGALVLGLLMEDFEEKGREAIDTLASFIANAAMSTHQALGLLVLALAAFRIAWRLVNPMPSLPADSKPWEEKLARAVQVLLIAGLIVVPLSGWLMVNAKGHQVSFLGLFSLPSLVGSNHALHEIVKEIHEATANLMIALVGLHVIGALKHHFIDRDFVLRRMLGRSSEISAAT